ncbi:MAG TPA: PIG-L deacetylase family protein [Rhodocyclaceae bacterium]|nr:PIG-L deacetylase family protein [Rhodocyclaceae bacterium]
MKVLVVAAHPDDEVLGCGGTMAAHAARGDEVRVLILGEGAASRHAEAGAVSRAEISALEAAAAAAAQVLGAQAPRFGGLPDNRLDTVPLLNVVRQVETGVAEAGPEVVYTHFPGDTNIDHRIAFEAVITACRPQPGAVKPAILCFEVPSSTEWRPPVAAPVFAPTWYVDIAGTLEAKLKALAAYGTEIRSWPHPRSLEAVTHLARWRGASVGVAAAEAFVLARAFGLPGGGRP